MEDVSILYENRIDFGSKIDHTYFEKRRDIVRTYSMVWQVTLFIVDHFTRHSYFYHNNPACCSLFGNTTSRELVVDYFLESYISKTDEGLFETIITAIKDTMWNNFLDGDKYFYFSFNLLLGKHGQKNKQYSFMAFPYLYTSDNKVWATVYQITPSSCTTSGNLKLYTVNKQTCYNFDMESNSFCKENITWRLSEKEKRILKMSAEGFTEGQIADHLKINIGVLKNHKVKIFEKMNASTIYEAISKAFKNGDI